MVLDTSALLTVLQDEPERVRFADAIEALRQNGNGRLQLERLLLGARELRHG